MTRRSETRRARARLIGSVALAVAGAVTLAACTPGGETAPTATPSLTATPSSTAAPTEVPAGPVLVPEGSAEDNLPLFTAVTAAVWATPDNLAGRAYIDALVAAGFDKSAMQVTFDETTVGNPAESIQFAVRWQEQCLVGQVGPATGAPVTVVVPVVAGGSCLIGSTRPIDW